MTATSYVALLRGIDVGVRNKVPMAALRTTFEAAVTTACGRTSSRATSCSAPR